MEPKIFKTEIGGKPVEIAYLNVGLGSEFLDNIIKWKRY